jgi:trimeric autotransporter adhesin
LLGNTTGSNNTGIGSYALEYNLSGSNLTALGYSALGLAYAESFSVAIGSFALANSNSGTGSNTAIGANSMNFNTSGYFNVASGANAMYSNTTGYNNTASGVLSMYLNTIGTYNVATGIGSMYDNTSGNYNVGNGTYALESNSSGVRNTAVGAYALESSTTGDRNSALGYDADINAGNLNNATAIGAGSQATASNSVVIGSSAVTSVGGYANWTNFSDGRYKQNIQQNIPGLAFINKLKPITYTLDISGIENKLHENQKPPSSKNGGAPENFLNDPRVKQSMQEKSAIFYSGFIAQDVEKAADSLGYNFSGIDKPKYANQSFYGLRYGDFVVPLVKAVQELSLSSNQKDSTINSLQEKVDSMQTQINEIRAMLLSKNQSSGLSIPGATLDQNVPNPISNSTTIAYGLPQGTSSAQMQISDMTGKILQTISLSGVGRNTLTLDTSSYASGTYCYSLLINGQLAGTKKMVSVR